MNMALGNHALDPLHPKPVMSSHKGIILVVLKDGALIVPCKDSSERMRWGSDLGAMKGLGSGLVAGLGV